MKKVFSYNYSAGEILKYVGRANLGPAKSGSNLGKYKEF